MDLHGPFRELSQQYELLQTTLTDIEGAVEGRCHEDLMEIHRCLKVWVLTATISRFFVRV